MTRAPETTPVKTLRELKAAGRDPFVMFRAEEALLMDGAWLARVVNGGPLLFWDGEDMPAPRDAYAVENGVAVVRVEGPLVQRGWMCFEGYDTIARKLGAALDDSQVRAVVLAVNSPGGAAAGCFEAVRAMRQRVEASGKHVVAYSDEIAFSGGYAIACVADEIVVPETGGVGSVGVIAGLQSFARALDKQGIDVRVISSGAEKADGHPGLPLDEAAVARAQARVDELAAVFFRTVAARRGMTADAVAALEAGVRYGAAAVSSGLADRVAPLAEVVASLHSTTPGPRRGAMSAGPARSATPQTATRNTAMIDEKIAALIAARTHETDPERQLGALTAVFDAAAKVPELEQKLLAREAAEKEAAEKAEKAARLQAFEGALKGGQDEGKLTPAEAEQWRADFAKGEVSLGVLEGNLARRSAIPALSQEHKDLRPPASPPTGGGLKPRIAELAARPYAALTWNERNELALGAPDTHDRLYRQWVEDGRPKAPAAR